jgi:hypothetical protein
MRIFKTKSFNKWSQKIKINDLSLIKVINELEDDLFDAKLGAYLFKKRIAIGSKGKRSGLRTIIAYKQNEKAFFLHGFSKTDQENISETEKMLLLKLGYDYINTRDILLKKLIAAKKLFELV